MADVPFGFPQYTGGLEHTVAILVSLWGRQNGGGQGGSSFDMLQLHSQLVS